MYPAIFALLLPPCFPAVRREIRGSKFGNGNGTVEQEPMMAKIMKRTVDTLQPEPDRDVFAWDSELRGFGVRVKPSGVKTFLIQYRNVEARTRRLVLGQYGALTPEAARDLARK
jgi:Arm DNA-binding domain